ncbi:MAG: alkaline phosphatase family protein, partial [Actinomycetota bacterium]
MSNNRRRPLLAIGTALAIVAVSCSGDANDSGRADGACSEGWSDAPALPIPDLEGTRVPDPGTPATVETTTPIKHVVFLIKENRSFDHFFGVFPGANGTSEGMLDGKPVALRDCIKPTIPRDLLHSYPMALLSWNEGKMDGFGCEMSLGIDEPPPSLTLGPGLTWTLDDDACTVDPYKEDEAYSQADPRDIPNYWYMAENYSLADNFFASAMGPSFPNHLMSIAASSAGTWDNPETPTEQAEMAKQAGYAKTWGCDAPAGTTVMREWTSPEGETEVSPVFPCFTDVPTEGDLLSAEDIPWAYYAATPEQAGYMFSAFSSLDRYRNDQ